MTILSTIIGCLIANIIFMVIIGYVLYRFINKNKTVIAEAKKGLSDALTSLQEIDFNEMTSSINEAMEKISKTLDELKKIKE